mgnify:CR=1 FL=1
MKTVKPVSQETYERIGAAYAICSKYPDIFGDVTMKRFCSMFVDDIVDEGEDLIEARKKAYADEMYALLKAAFGDAISFTEITRLGVIAQELLDRIDSGEEDTSDE